ncbi:hypothetical protein SMMN14_07920 [Sphaerulina musiva]
MPPVLAAAGALLHKQATAAAIFFTSLLSCTSTCKQQEEPEHPFYHPTRKVPLLAKSRRPVFVLRRGALTPRPSGEGGGFSAQHLRRTLRRGARKSSSATLRGTSHSLRTVAAGFRAEERSSHSAPFWPGWESSSTTLRGTSLSLRTVAAGFRAVERSSHSAPFWWGWESCSTTFRGSHSPRQKPPSGFCAEGRSSHSAPFWRGWGFLCSAHTPHSSWRSKGILFYHPSRNVTLLANRHRPIGSKLAHRLELSPGSLCCDYGPDRCRFRAEERSSHSAPFWQGWMHPSSVPSPHSR